jgi:hypothetical protein
MRSAGRSSCGQFLKYEHAPFRNQKALYFWMPEPNFFLPHALELGRSSKPCAYVTHPKVAVHPAACREPIWQPKQWPDTISSGGKIGIGKSNESACDRGRTMKKG